jgi:hypothetical protein
LQASLAAWAHNLLKNQIAEQEHAAKIEWEIQLAKLIFL